MLDSRVSNYAGETPRLPIICASSQSLRQRLLAFTPELPSTDAIVPYLRQIDQARVYSNHGPLVISLQERLETLFGVPDGSVLAASSGTSALMAGILAHGGRAKPERPYAICPGYTFVATASAVELCGYLPYFVDVSPLTWMLDPDELLNHPMLSQVGLVVPVSAYGKPIDMDGWVRFQQKTGIPVVVDAAAAFEAIADGRMSCPDAIPIALSFHATKVFACGEGGCLIWCDKDVSTKAFQALNFGFFQSRNSQIPSFNGKMSEYHAAIGLAELDEWSEKIRKFKAAHDFYEAAIENLSRNRGDFYLAPEISSNYVLCRIGNEIQANNLALSLNNFNIETRFWYGQGLHRHVHFANARRDVLPVTEKIASELMGLPVSTLISLCDVEDIFSEISKI